MGTYIESLNGQYGLKDTVFLSEFARNEEKYKENTTNCSSDKS